MEKASPEHAPAGARSVGGPLKLVAELRCDDCGSFRAFDLGERRLCEDCYRACGSCCLEFGADDLWSRDA
jgi:hypothetical protein